VAELKTLLENWGGTVTSFTRSFDNDVTNTKEYEEHDEHQNKSGIQRLPRFLEIIPTFPN
jgi:hypothetical protein